MSIKKGIYAASISVINDDLSINVDATIKHSEKLIKNGCHGCVIFGSTGQAQLISSNEKKKLIEKLKDSKFKDCFILGTGVNSLNENVELIQFAIKNGINRFLLGVPAYYKFGDEGCYAYFSNLIQKVPEIKFLVYNFEKLFNYKFSIQIIEKLVKNYPDSCLGLKDSTYNLFDKVKINKNFLIFPGSETKLKTGLELNNSGIISAICNVTAPLARRVYDDFHNKKEQIFNERLCGIRKIFDKNNLISGLHTFMSFENKKYKNILPPLSLLSKEQEKQMMDDLRSLDFYPEKNIAA
tara:strand:+ start:43 stop:930 length:888 start_codon:yes stop_codon:yes gene_type:complete